ncbi:hypothetical protein XENORESO_018477 [Xenotaenia resolanae]|uniref:Secreted protein n=1 Tax=Xenotaenia resolanae TaxID=208358 RepID=A0ABV0WIC3_9TELE
MNIVIHLLYRFFHSGSWGSWCLSAAVYRREAGYILDRSPSIAGQHRDIQDKQPCTQTFIPKANLERPVNLTVMFLDCGRKPEYSVRTHGCTGRTCKLHHEKSSCRKTPGQELNPPPCSLDQHIYILF